jgi:hypothetical protein
VWAWHQTITDQDHLDAANRLRRDRDRLLRPVRDTTRENEPIAVEERRLTDYDTALGIDLDANPGTGMAARGQAS